MTNNRLLPYARQHLDQEDFDAVRSALTGDLITRGPLVEQFEKEFAAYCGAAHAVAFSSGSAALSAAYFAVKTAPGDRVLTTANTFIATAGTAVQQGALPVFVDIDRKTGSLNIDSLVYNANIPQSRGKPILAPVHFAGLPVDMEQVNSQLTNPESVVIEDAAHAIGSNYPNGGPKVGSCAWSDITIFSLHPAKTMTTGEGGIATTNDAELFRRLKLYRNNGMERDAAHLQNRPAPWYYEVQNLSNNYNFTEFQAALGLSQLKKLDHFADKRRALMAAYREKLKDFPNLSLFTDSMDSTTAFHLCVAQIDFGAFGIAREEVMDQLKKQNIGTQVHYIPLYRHPIFATRAGDLGDYFPETEAYYSQALSLPLFYDMTIEDVSYVVDSLRSILRA